MGLLDESIQAQLPLEPAVFHIMLAVSATPLDGYRILQFVHEQTDHKLEIGIQSIYDQIKVMLKLHYIEPALEMVDASVTQRKLFVLTNYGRQVLRAEIRRMEGLVRQAYQFGLMDD